LLTLIVSIKGLIIDIVPTLAIAPSTSAAKYLYLGESALFWSYLFAEESVLKLKTISHSHFIIMLVIGGILLRALGLRIVVWVTFWLFFWRKVKKLRATFLP